ncbi:WecB/TagA/CpsF family glycosyltransferase [Telluribacter sp.]|jgi:N-acetylglucosaminyldiphosphoundecaprenol N-acetyl-beta-D-mannosaminyltransferase|uniref:WecB/TagA/CpsF family glycosyltransferase n=1 Tax=Telluribacter sp. TaxID=1978767 RepID=UPI002E140640|nr:WecB/TagA/CpsF family glycosyltransferase [Telluribacter sp.]
MKKLFNFFPITVNPFTSVIDEIIFLATKKRSYYICVANVHMVGEAKSDSEMARALYDAELVIPDGMPLVFVMRWLYGINQERVAGCDLFPLLLARSAQVGIKVFFLGSTEYVLQSLVERCRVDIPNLIIAGIHSPPFRPATFGERVELIQTINESGAQLVFVSLGCPKQEKWMAEMKGNIHCVMIGVGNAFPVYARVEKLAPQWMRELSLEWIFRLCQDPKRLWKRYLFNNTIFLKLFIKEWIKIKLLNNSSI